MNSLRSNLVIGAPLAAGHFGQVFLADDLVHGQVAVKVFRQQPMEATGDWLLRKAGLLAEGQRLKVATHPNVVQVFHLVESETNDAIHLVMECCRGGSLQTTFENGPLPLHNVRNYATQICLGLQALHARGMIHRDIKPGNLLLDEHGTAKLGDFGLVTDKIIFGYASAAGYSDHLAYEIWQGSGTSVKSDIWALGMTIYRLLHGREWYLRSPAPRYVVGNGGFADSLPWLPHITPKWRRFVRKMLNDDSDRRFQNANLVMAALAKLETEPRWACEIAPNETRWELVKGGRRTRVVWQQHGPHSFSWDARSEPLGHGNRRHLGGSTGRIGRAESDREMRDFFERKW
jgi:eukaryotic-like serine/threonine-protein kinase